MLLSSTWCVQPVPVLLVILLRPPGCCHQEGGLTSAERATFTSSSFWTTYQTQVRVGGIPEPVLWFILVYSIGFPLHCKIISDNFRLLKWLQDKRKKCTSLSGVLRTRHGVKTGGIPLFNKMLTLSDAATRYHWRCWLFCLKSVHFSAEWITECKMLHHYQSCFDLIMKPQALRFSDGCQL